MRRAKTQYSRNSVVRVVGRVLNEGRSGAWVFGAPKSSDRGSGASACKPGAHSPASTNSRTHTRTHASTLALSRLDDVETPLLEPPDRRLLRGLAYHPLLVQQDDVAAGRPRAREVEGVRRGENGRLGHEDFPAFEHVRQHVLLQAAATAVVVMVLVMPGWVGVRIRCRTRGERIRRPEDQRRFDRVESFVAQVVLGCACVFGRVFGSWKQARRMETAARGYYRTFFLARACADCSCMRLGGGGKMP